MKTLRVVSLLVAMALSASCLLAQNASRPLPRIAIAGLAIESSTFSPARTHEVAFHARRGSEVFDAYPFMATDSPLRQRATWLPALTGKSLPGGTVTRE